LDPSLGSATTSTTAEAVIDTNVLVYAVSRAAADRAKRDVALDLVQRLEFGLSGQVLAEFYNAVTRKIRVPLSPDEALDWIEALEDCPCVAVDASLVRYGADLSTRYRLSYWDGAILAAAHRLNASVLYSEDMSHGATYGAVRVENPFKKLH
jgi:predicted nucleic acid-binding protein